MHAVIDAIARAIEELETTIKATADDQDDYNLSLTKDIRHHQTEYETQETEHYHFKLHTLRTMLKRLSECSKMANNILEGDAKY